MTTLSLPDRGSTRPRVPTIVEAAPAPQPAQSPVSVQPPAPAPVPAPSHTLSLSPAAPVVVAPPAAPEAAPRAATSETPAPRPGQPPPVDAVEARLRETARTCLVSYRGWKLAPGETSTQALNDAVHELRKVLARIEIDMSACRREDQGLRPIPVPAHRAARQQQQR